ncbi:MAG: insulinase family protein [Sphingomonadales bacterium]
MLSFLRRYARPLVLFIAIPLAVPSQARDTVPKAAQAETPSWLYRGSDVPPDKEWIFGELKNGLRYAVRKNGVPPGQVSIRVAIDAGSLNETKGEEGFAHFNEHLSFRRSKYVPDGEAKRLFQRLGATFGSDTNAATTPTQTIYKLDLPAATPRALKQTVKVLSGMMSAPVIGREQVDAERRTVLAELREGTGPGQRVGDATRETFFAGQALGKQSPIGSIASLEAATPEGLRGFHDRWYRPEKALVIISGDGDPAMFEALIKKNFSKWKGIGPTPAEPDFGKPDAAAARTRIVVEPGLPTLVSLVVLRPWVQKNDTIAYNRGKLVEGLALRLISRRLEERARAGGSFLSASVDQSDVSRSVDGTFIQIVPLGEDWQASVRDVRAVIADALANPSTQADIDREANEFLSSLQVGVEQARTQNGGDLADNLIEAVSIRETVASPEVAYEVFAGSKDSITPATILEATKRMFTGAPMRALLTIPKEVSGADALLLAALTSAPKPLATTARTPVSFDRVPKLPVPGTVVRRSAVASMGLDFVDFSNGVRAIIFANNAEAGNVYVSVRFGRGMKALPANRPTDAWAASGALIASGIGDLKQDELDRLTSARRINMGFSIADDAFVLSSTTRAVDLPDQLKLLAAKLAYPGWDPAPVIRARAAMAMSFASSDTTPGAVLGRTLPGLLHGGDPRWTFPSLAQVQAMTPQSFRALWEPLLATGPIEISVFGDVDKEAAIAAIAASVGALPVRTEAPVAEASASSPSVVPNTTPIVRIHRGPVDQAAAVLAWPTAGGATGTYESRKLDVLAAIFNDRMFDQLREGEGASYSPNVSSSWPAFMPGGGSFIVTSQLNPKGVDRFFAISKAIAADLAAKPPSADEIARSVGPLKQYIARASSGNGFWLGQLQGATSEPSRITNVTTLTYDYGRITPAELQEAAKRWLVPSKSFSMVVLPEAKPEATKP